jgi:hypothetical protein
MIHALPIFLTNHLLNTQNIVQKGVGGPLMDFDGNVIGMNFYDKKGTPFLPGFIVLKCLLHFANFGYAFCYLSLHIHFTNYCTH